MTYIAIDAISVQMIHMVIACLRWVAGFFTSTASCSIEEVSRQVSGSPPSDAGSPARSNSTLSACASGPFGSSPEPGQLHRAAHGFNTQRCASGPSIETAEIIALQFFARSEQPATELLRPYRNVTRLHFS